MKIFKNFILATILIGCSGSLNAQNNPYLNATDIINRAVEAKGGEEYLQSIKTLYTDAKIEMQGRKVDWIVREMRPNLGSLEVIYKGRSIYKSWFDGKNGYEIVNREKKADDNDFKDKKFKKNIFDELDYLDSSLWKLELIGEEKVGSELCYKIKATLVNGLIENLYYDKKTFYLLKSENIGDPETHRVTTTINSKFKKFDKLTYPTEIKLGTGNQFQIAKIVDLEINKLVSDQDFK